MLKDFNRTEEAQEIFKDKKRPKGEIKYKIKLTEEQKKVKEDVYNYDINFVLGNFGSGKTAVATAIALDMLHKKHVDTIIVARPFDFGATGYLSGSLEEKLQYHMMPIKQNFYACYDPIRIEEYYKDKKIQILPIPYLRGVTFTNSCVIVDEIQETTYSDFKLILSRLGRDSKMIFTGSAEQNTMGDRSAINKILTLSDCTDVSFNILKSNHRNESIEKVLKFLGDEIYGE